jgi:endonuclease/exonuclease/phosphatase family metal-dependent hydrolase
MHTRVSLGLFVAVIALAAACSDSDAPPAKTGAVATYNLGLAYNFVPYAKERRAPVADLVAQTDADVLCLQEVWLDDDVTLVAAKAKPRYPHAHFAKTVDPAIGGPPACTPTDAEPLRVCTEKHCQGAASLAECALKNCIAQYTATTPKCQTCLAANIALNAIDLIFDACAKDSGTLTFGGRNGLMLLSKQPFTKTDVLKFESFQLQRVVLYGQTAIAGAPSHVFCTHLQAGLGAIAYNGKHGGWEAEQAAEIDALVKWVGEKAGSERTLVLGDMNCGPAVAEAKIDPEFENNFNKFAAAKLTAPWLSGPSTQCTWCAANQLGSAKSNRVIDHVLLKAWPPLQNVQRKRIGDTAVSIQLATGATETHLSDHFGAQVSFELP